MDTLGSVVVSWLRHMDCRLKREPLLLLGISRIPAEVLRLDTDVLENWMLSLGSKIIKLLIWCFALHWSY